MPPRPFAALILLASQAALGATFNVGPTDSWCQTVNDAGPGDEVVFQSGDYPDTCWIRAQGESGNPVLVRSASEATGERATFTYAGNSSNVIDLDGPAHVILRGFRWEATQAGVDAIKTRTATDVVIERCEFFQVGGISISANSGDSERLTVRDNSFVDLQATGMYFGCHNGSDCHATDVRIERNLIDGVTSSGVGYGFEVKLNSWATIRDNTVLNTQGPCLMVYGSDRGDPASLIEGNYVETSRTDGGILVGGGPAMVRNNVAVDGSWAGIVAQDYNGRDLMDDVWIVHNTVLGGGTAGIIVQGWTADRGNVLAYNAVLQTPALQPASAAGIVVGNVDCTANDCFVDDTGPVYDLWPSASGPLLDTAGNGTEPWRPSDDFMGELRGGATDIGAFERTPSGVSHVVGGGARPPRLDNTNDGGPIDDGADGSGDGGMGDGGAGDPTMAGDPSQGDESGVGDASPGDGSSAGDARPGDSARPDAIHGGCHCGARISLWAVVVLLPFCRRRR